MAATGPSTAAPRTDTGTLRRPRILERVRERTAGRRLTVVVAGPGFGKSTLLAEWAAGEPSAWLTITPDDGVLEVFARRMLAALRERVPTLPRSFGGARGPAADQDAQADAVAALLANAMARDPDAVRLLVLDDLHELPPRSASIRCVQSLVRQAPYGVQVVLSSREEPPFRLQRLRGRGEVLDVDASVLAFSEEEVEALLASSLEGPPGDLAHELYELTGGWPAAARLAAEALRAVPEDRRASMLGRVRRPEGPLFSYLAEEVLAPQPTAVRELLRCVAPFDRFSAGLCEALGAEGAEETLRSLARRGLVLEATADVGWYALHSLIREFAREAWPSDADELRDLHLRAAAWFDAHGRFDESLRSLAAAGDVDALADRLLDRGPLLLAAGHVETVIRAIEAVPPARRTPEIERLAGEARQVRGDWDEALACFRRAEGGSGRPTAATAWRIGVIRYLRGELDDALETFARADLAGAEPREEALLLSWAATARWVRGELVESRQLAARALELATLSEDHQALAAAHTVLAMISSLEGDRAATHQHSARALRHAESAGDVLQLIRIRTNRGSHLADEGAYEEALGDLEEAIRLADLASFVNFQALGLSNRGETRLRLGRLDEALADLEAARGLYQRIESRALCYPLGHLGDVHRERGELSLARAVYEEAIRIAEASGDAQGLAPALAGLARVSAADDPGEASRLCERALEVAAAFGRVPALLASGWVALGRGDRSAAEAFAADAIRDAGERRDRAGLAEAIELQVLASEEPEPARLDEAIAIWKEIGNPVGEARARLTQTTLLGDGDAAADAERRLQALRVRTRPPLAAGTLAELPATQKAVVEIRTLGGFAVYREGLQVAMTEWQSKKARDVLKILVARRGRATPRDVLMEALWPEEDPGRVANRLSVALSVLRAVLDPERRFGQEHFVAADKDSARLVLDHVDVDVEAFLAGAESGLAARAAGRGEAVAQLVAAEAVYGGDFLDDDPYEDWALPLREEALAAYIAVAGALAADAAAAGDHDTAVRYFLRVLSRDEYDEGAHLGLVATLEGAGRHGEARRAYRAYAAKMDEIGVESAPFPDAAVSAP